jgi:hypothetical protein
MHSSHIPLNTLGHGGSFDMRRNILAACIVSVALTGIAAAQEAAPTTANRTHYTPGEIKKLEHEARSPEQYGILATYYGDQQKTYLEQAAQEKQEWDRRSQNVMVVAARYPRPVDSARNLYEYYMYKASQAGALSGKYSQLTTGAVQ